ncbi:hypothetical protein EYF80_034747 [Liparis tanakae]|uniref:Uncharacterized protein n=1 Tax=Liparis tanakae TaxID=230148 RepID=A0A4Z2GP30_9TELE|nr:hypothetical protein EYF80_034747 [Liparis tanakae]
MVQKQALTGGLREGPWGLRLFYWAGALQPLQGEAGLCTAEVASNRQTTTPPPPPGLRKTTVEERRQRQEREKRSISLAPRMEKVNPGDPRLCIPPMRERIIVLICNFNSCTTGERIHNREIRGERSSASLASQILPRPTSGTPGSSLPQFSMSLRVVPSGRGWWGPAVHNVCFSLRLPLYSATPAWLWRVAKLGGVVRASDTFLFCVRESPQPELPNEMAWREFAACNHGNPGRSSVICPRRFQQYKGDINYSSTLRELVLRNMTHEDANLWPQT